MQYLEEQANEETGVRFYDAVLRRVFRTRVDRLEGLRRFPVTGAFSKYLIFYQITQTGIDVVRVLHGSREVEAILNQETGA